MIQNYLKISLRNLLKNRTFSVLNIVGWALGMAACLVMLLFVQNEISFDTFHTKALRIFRLGEVQKFNGMIEQNVALSMLPMAEAFQKDYPEIEATVRLYDLGKVTLKQGDTQILAPDFLQADSTFFKIFDFEAIRGNVKMALSKPNNIVITQKMAQKVFGIDDVVGKTLLLNRGSGFAPFSVSVVLKNLPQQSHLQFEGLIPMHELTGKMEPWMEGWDSNWLVTYLLFRENTKPEKVIADLSNYEKRYLKKDAKYYDLFLQPFTNVHLGSTHITHDGLNYQKFDRQYVRVFVWLAFFVLLIASFNFINLTTARATKRAKEVGIRKVVGAKKNQLIGQFVGESVLITLLALILAIVLVILALPYLNELIERELSLVDAMSPLLLLAIIGVAVFVGILAGMYPALLMSSYQSVRVLKGVFQAKYNQFSFRNGLVVMQFSIAIALIIATGLAVRQLNYIRSKDIGLDKEEVIVIPMNALANKNYETFRNELLQNANITDVTASSQRLGNNIGQMGADFKGKAGAKHYSVSHLIVDYNFLEFYKIKLLKGRTFSKQFSQDKEHAFIVNEAFAKEMGEVNPISKPFKAAWHKEYGTVIGMTKDFNFNSLHNKIAPLYISIQGWDFSEMSVKVKAANASQALQHIEYQWNKLVPDLPFSYTFLNDHFEQLYKTDTQVSQIIKISTFLAILIACMGLFGLAMFAVEIRTKEIGIRKVLGASVVSITALLSKDFLKLVFVAIVLASPIAWYAMDKWLQDFAYRIEISWWVFALAGVLAFAIALLTVSYQSIKAALMNPVKSLRIE